MNHAKDHRQTLIENAHEVLGIVQTLVKDVEEIRDARVYSAMVTLFLWAKGYKKD